jgi:uncharacterized phage-associated protein
MFQAMMLNDVHTPIDARIVANEIIEFGLERGYEVTNLSVQKLLYFTHAHFLVRNNSPLVNGVFEAWQFGPVHPTVYSALKKFGAKPIDSLIQKVDPVTREKIELPKLVKGQLKNDILDIVAPLIKVSAGFLVDMSHVRGGPWDTIVEQSKNGAVLGLRITDEITKEKFRYQKTTVGIRPRSGDPSEDSPLE